MKNSKKNSVRLPNHISPTHYDLLIRPDLESFTYSGKETIKIKIGKDTNEITLHSKDIYIETVKYSSGKKEIFADKISYNTKNETAMFHFKNKIKKGNGKLSITFYGIISESLRGFYRSKYTLNGQDKFIATTQFEATDARRAFPCFDEPAQKAIFKVSFIVADNHSVISNTLPEEIKEHEAGFKIVSFSPTPKMSTYLLAFVIGEFEYVEGYVNYKAKSVNNFSRSGPSSSLVRGPEKLFTDEASKNGSKLIKVRIYTTHGKKHQARFALDVAIRALEFYNNYFDIPYPLPTLDLIAIPDFESAAMENWGAITFREASLLVDEKNSSFINKQWIAIVIAHEIAHQWFGNLVTMHWWTDLWLNEGFASYMEKLCTDKLFPHWKIWDSYIANDRLRMAIKIDSSKYSHPIEVDVHHPDEISETFDMVSYEKGTAMIRMLNEYIGENNFQKGLRYYLKKHSYKNTKTKDLWEAFEKSSGKPVSKMMSSWTRQMGYPVLSLLNNKNGYELTQERFLSNRNTKRESSLWQIPLSYIIDNKKSDILITKKKIKFAEEKNIIGKININETSFLKVKYDDKTIDKLVEDIKSNHIKTIDRLGIIRDAFDLAQGGYIKTTKTMEIVSSHKNENNYYVWSEIASGLKKIYNIIDDIKTEEKYKKFVLSLFSPLVDKVGFEKKEKETTTETLLRALIISQAGFYGDKEVIKKIKNIFDNRIVKQIDPDIRNVVYNIIAENGGTKDWKILKNMYESEHILEEKERIGIAMSIFKDEKIVEKTLYFAISNKVRTQDAPFMIVNAWNNKKTRDITWKFIKDNWNIILKKYGEGGMFLSRIIFALGNHTDIKTIKEAKIFFKKHTAPGAQNTLKQAYENIEANYYWWKDDKKDIQSWLDKNY